MKREMIKEEYCTFENCKLLKEAGFPQDDNYLCWYDDEGRGVFDQYRRTYTSRPTQSLAMRWLREEHHISVEPLVTLTERWCLNVWEFSKRDMIISLDDPMRFDTHEAAAEAGIQAACRYIIEKGGGK